MPGAHAAPKPSTTRWKIPAIAIRRAAILVLAALIAVAAALGIRAMLDQPTRGEAFPEGSAPAGVSAQARYGDWISFDSGMEAKIEAPVKDESGIWRADATVRNPGDAPTSFAGVTFELPEGAQRIYDDASPMQVGNIDAHGERTWSIAVLSQGDEAPVLGIRPSPVQDLTVRFVP